MTQVRTEDFIFYMSRFQLTREGKANLEIELSELTTKKRASAVERLSKARSMGDLSENSEYHAAKEDLGVVEGRVRELQELLKHVEVVESTAGGTSISLGSHISVETSGNKQTFNIVGEFEADPMAGKLSSTSPIGRALLGKKVGESVEIIIPAGKTTYKVLKIS